MEKLEDRRVLAVIVWDGGGGDNDWNNAANWFDETNEVDDVLPASSDDVEIRDPFADETIEIVNMIATVNSLQTAAGLHIQSGHSGAAGTALNLSSDSRFDGPVHFVSGYLGAESTLTITDTMTWSGGTLRDEGTLVIAKDATLVLDSPGNTADSRTIENFGTIQWNSGTLSASDPLTINNRSGALLDVRGGDRLGSSGSGRIVNNEGTLRKSAGTGRSQIFMTFNNTGSVEVESGTLAFVRRGSSTGSFSYDAGTTLEFQAEFNNPFTMTLGPTASLVGEGRLLVARDDLIIEGDGQMEVALIEILGSFGRLRLNRDASVPEILFSGGLLGGTGTLTVTKNMLWTAGNMADGGTLRIAEGATLSHHNGGMTTGGHTIENFGTVQLLDGKVGAGGSSPLTINNRPGALFDIRTNSTVGQTGSTFNNAGTLRKLAGTGRSDLAMRLNNSGLVQVETGTLAFTRGGTSTGSFSFDAGTTLELQGDANTRHRIAPDPGAAVIGEGRLLISQHDVAIEGSGSVDIELFQLEGGSFIDVEINRDISIPKVLLVHGALGGTGTLTVSDDMQWIGGNMSGGGTTLIADEATLTIDANSVNIRGDNFPVKGRTIDNRGTIHWLSGNIDASEPLTLRNRPGAVFDIQTDSSFGNNVSGRNFINEGTLRKSAGAGSSSFAMRLNNTAKGTVQVDTGTLALSQTLVQGASSSGRIVGDGRLVIGTELAVAGGPIEIDTVQISIGSGRGSLTGKMFVNADVSIPRLVFLRGELGGPGTLTLTENMDWFAGDMTDGAAWVIDSAARLDIDADSVGIKAGARTIDNHGTVNWQRGTVNVSAPIAFNNHAEATFEIGSGATWGHTVGTLHNWGTVRLEPGSGTSTMVIDVVNEGLIDIGGETLNLTRGMKQTSGTTLLDGGVLVAGGGLALEGGMLQGEGTVDGNVTHSGGSIQPGPSLGVLTIDGDYTASGGELLVEIAGPPTDGNGNDLAGTNYNRLHVTGDVLLGGHLQVEVLGNDGLQRGDVYNVVTTNGLDGSYASTNANDVGTLLLVEPQAVQLEVFGETLTWDGGGDGEDWHDRLNWSADRLPRSPDDVVLRAGDSVVIEQDADVRQLQVDEDASLFLYNATLDATLDVSGTLTVRGDSAVQGNVTTTATGAVTLSGFGRSGGSRIGNAIFTVDGDFLNQGELILHGREAVRIHPSTVGNEVRLVMTQGTFVNQGHVWTREPVVDNGTFRYEILGAIENRGLVELVGEDLRIDSPNFLDEGDIVVADNRTLIISDRVTYGDGSWTGAGRVDLTQAQVNLISPLQVDASTPELYTDRTTFAGPEGIRLADEADLMLYQSTIEQDLHVAGELTVRGQSMVQGNLTTAPTGSITLSGFGRSGASRQGT